MWYSSVPSNSSAPRIAAVTVPARSVASHATIPGRVRVMVVAPGVQPSGAPSVPATSNRTGARSIGRAVAAIPVMLGVILLENWAGSPPGARSTLRPRISRWVPVTVTGV